MGKKRSLYTLDEWNREADLGNVEEPPWVDGAPSTGIECPNILDANGKVCQAHLHDLREGDKARPTRNVELWDLPWVVWVSGEEKKAVACRTCGWFGWRNIAGV